MSAWRRTSSARAPTSARLPIGVATTYRIPGGMVNAKPGSGVKGAMNPAGARAEDLCADLMRRAGLRILARNWRCRHGEIDLVAEESGTLVFAEVRLRRDAGYGGAAESVTAAKRARLLAAARLYLAGRPEAGCRFDVLLLDALAPERIRWIRDAFGE